MTTIVHKSGENEINKDYLQNIAKGEKKEKHGVP